MKKIILTFIIIITLFIFNKAIITQIIIFTSSKLIDRNISIKNIDIDYSKKIIILNFVEVENINKLYYKNIFEADKIKIQYNFKSLFTDLIIIDDLIFFNAKFFLEIEVNDDVISNDNIEEVKKLKDDYKPKKYPIKKKDTNFLILAVKINNTQGVIKSSNKKNEIKIDLSNMSFKKIGNKEDFQHYKQIFKILLADFYLKIPDEELRNLIKKTYKL